MSVTCELFVATDGAARRYDHAWEEQADLGEADDWLDEASDDLDPAADFEPDEDAPGPLDEARDALAEHEPHNGLYGRHLVALWKLLDGHAGAAALEVVPADGHRHLYRVPAAFNELLATLPEARVAPIAKKWGDSDAFPPGAATATDTLRALMRMAGRARHHGLHLFLYEIA
jgi:hypothetical protein